MLRQISLWLLAAVLSLPLVHFAGEKLAPPTTVDYNSAEWHARQALIARARVMVDPPPDVSARDLSRLPDGAEPIDRDEPVTCTYLPKPVKATTPKFDCTLPGGRVIKIKYGRTPEKSGEVAATRLLAALGFPADRVAMAERVVCIGCPWFPFQMRRLAESFFAAPALEALTPGDGRRAFTWVAVEQKMPGRAVKVGEHEGWDWDELSLVDASKGGATRAELDALRLMAVFLSHWDNKATNQRLFCEERDDDADALEKCSRPMLMIQDAGATFGPTKVQHDRWSRAPIWKDHGQCLVSLEHLPYRGGRFEPAQVSEAGRALLAARLSRLSTDQVRAIFSSARFPHPVTGRFTGAVEPWVQTFFEKVRQIADRPPCPISDQ